MGVTYRPRSWIPAFIMLSALKAEKKLLRKAMASKLRNIPSIPDQSAAVTKRVLALPCFTQAKSVSCYLSMPSGEVDTSSLAREILRTGKTLYVPKIDTAADGRMELLRIYNEPDLDSLPAGVWGIKEPDRLRDGEARTSAEDADAGIDLILVPGLAFDQSFSRLGHGKGYYDRFITKYTNNRKRPVLVALSLREQLLDDAIPTAEYDCKMDWIITPDEQLVQHQHGDA
ncbi:5-formyltetrahydrofolate cyclo-ligase [Mycena kentingensis (nom. inval.)]|nr:5-formyltetrahydrofolate cyclo-ligase [Mycena kentingensis (nom. inval.)]